MSCYCAKNERRWISLRCCSENLQFGHLLFWSKNFVLDLVFRNWHWGNFPNTSLYLTIEGENSEVSTKKQKRGKSYNFENVNIASVGWLKLWICKCKFTRKVLVAKFESDQRFPRGTIFTMLPRCTQSNILSRSLVSRSPGLLLDLVYFSNSFKLMWHLSKGKLPLLLPAM